MSNESKPQQQAIPQPQSSNVSIAEILRKGNLSVSDPGPVTPPTAQISTTPPQSPSSNSSGASAEGEGRKWLLPPECAGSATFTVPTAAPRSR